ncbi:hypothetical protein [Colwellia psychrerythraea]|uniref:Uncharacterized protein n=1 Tax=Colwellia psychrerythraea TaxID=28229 RepID=A0A099KQU8_COLPS|nr:hypothetical protein [Colwellia psychrerythraea]KGJ92038.1 hypothetical protein ND2E_3146 [Colwellia psychrerythraea]
MDLSYFYQKNADGSTLFDANQKPLLRKQITKTLEALQAQIAQNAKVETIDRFCAGVIELRQWHWLADYNEHIAILEFNANLPVVAVAENGDDVFAEPKDLPDEPIRPALLTVDEFKSANKALFDSYNKKQGVKINGYQVSLNKDNSDGLVSIKAGYELAGDDIFPTNFIADNASGTVSIRLDNFAEFSNFALQFLAARNALFN